MHDNLIRPQTNAKLNLQVSRGPYQRSAHLYPDHKIHSLTKPWQRVNVGLNLSRTMMSRGLNMPTVIELRLYVHTTPMNQQRWPFVPTSGESGVFSRCWSSMSQVRSATSTYLTENLVTTDRTIACCRSVRFFSGELFRRTILCQSYSICF